eukprot:5151794-Prymnesium_polylepis.1
MLQGGVNGLASASDGPSAHPALSSRRSVRPRDAAHFYSAAAAREHEQLSGNGLRRDLELSSAE